MQKYELLKSNDTMIRVLEIRPEQVLILDCIKRTMPVWVDPVVLDTSIPCSTNKLCDITGISISPIDSMNAEQRKIAYDRYTLIAPVLPFIADSEMRATVIHSISKEKDISKQTIRRYLCLYLAYMDITALIPKEKNITRPLTADEKICGGH